MTFSDTTNIRFHLGEVTTLAEMNAEMKSINSSQKFGGKIFYLQELNNQDFHQVLCLLCNISVQYDFCRNSLS